MAKSKINTCKQVKHICKKEALDIEFIMGKNNKLYLLQARPLVVSRKIEYNEKGVKMLIFCLPFCILPFIINDKKCPCKGHPGGCMHRHVI